jgi:microsomal dipeptidase-like Zn-dependent dipeptidase
MLSLEKCRELIPHEKELTDEQIEEIRETLYGLAELALESYFREKNLGKRDET